MPGASPSSWCVCHFTTCAYWWARLDLNQQCPSGTGFTVRCGTNYALLTRMGSPSKRGSMGKRRKETADVEFSRLLRKPRKRNGAGFFRRGDPCGTRTHICSLRGCRPDRLDEGANWGPRRSPAKRLRWGEGGNPKHSRRKPGSYETGIPEPCGGISDVVTPAGFEPGIAAVKGRCPVRLDERAMSAP